MTSERTALFVAHPGHELRVWHWVEQTRPLVCVLTDGSGAGGVSRLASMHRLLAHAGATLGPIQAPFTDRALYAALLAGDHAPFLALVARLGDALAAAGVTLLASDAIEGTNPAHDVCRLLADAAARVAARRRGGGPPRRFDFLLDGPPEPAPPPGAITFLLDGDALARKRTAVRDYPELAADVAYQLARDGVAAHLGECLRPVSAGPAVLPAQVLYEAYGAVRVASGVYTRVIRQDEHVRPLAAALERTRGAA
ncbi:MAG: hypothetical protein KIT14_24080 [bacterium]|nr:hypothetical protein [bacterium]